MATTDKPGDPNRPFVRINSPSDDPGNTRLDGDGNKRGTRRQSDYQPVRSLLEMTVISRLIALTPSWARTMGATEADAEHEVFGKLNRSFQTWTAAPPFHWHR